MVSTTACAAWGNPGKLSVPLITSVGAVIEAASLVIAAPDPPPSWTGCTRGITEHRRRPTGRGDEGVQVVDLALDGVGRGVPLSPRPCPRAIHHYGEDDVLLELVE
jgi:hypothetical protein